MKCLAIYFGCAFTDGVMKSRANCGLSSLVSDGKSKLGSLIELGRRTVRLDGREYSNYRAVFVLAIDARGIH